MVKQRAESTESGEPNEAGLPRLPIGWVWSTVGVVGEVQVGRQRSPRLRSGRNPTKYLRAANITWGGLDLDEVLEMNFEPSELATYALNAGDIVLTEASGSVEHVGKAALWGGEIDPCCFQNTVIRFRPTLIPAEYALIVFRHMAKTGVFVGASHGVGIAHLSARRFASLPFPLPPFAEQGRIAAEVRGFREELDHLRGSLQRIRTGLERYRDAVLESACSGNLVPAEAGITPGDAREFESGERLLARIGRARLAGVNDRRRETERSPELPFSEPAGEPSAIEPPTPILRVPYELPEGWVWTTLGAIADLKGGIAKGTRRRRDEPVRSVPYLRVANVQRGYLDLDEVKSIDATEREIAELRLEAGDVLFNEGGDRDKLGRGWVWRGELPECIHQNHVFRARLLLKELEPKFFSWYGNSTGRNYLTRAGKQTTNLASISRAKLGAMPVPLPPLAEQRRIVAEVERRLTAVGEIESVVAANLERVDLLEVTILRRAVGGRLSRQDPAERSARQLLDDILEARKLIESEKAAQRHKERGKLRVRKVRSSSASEASQIKRPLGEVLTQAGGPLAPHVLFERAGYDVNEPLDVESFYSALRLGIRDETIVEVRPNAEEVLLKAAV